MAVLPMKKISIYGLKENRKQILEFIQQQGVIQVTEGRVGKKGKDIFSKTDTEPAKNRFESSLKSLQNALGTLDGVVKPNKGLLDSLNGRTEITDGEYRKAVEESAETIALAGKINNLAQKMTDCKADIIRHETAIEALEPWLELDISMRTLGTKSTNVFVGTLPGDYNEEKLALALAEALPDAKGIISEVVSHSTQQSCIFVACHSKYGMKTEAALRALGLSYPAAPSKVPPKERVKLLESRIDQAKETLAACEKEIAAYANKRDSILYTIDYLTMRLEKYEVLGNLWQSKHIFLITGYILEEVSEKLKAELESFCPCVVEIKDVPKKETPPIMLRNNKFFEPVESVIESYSLPGKKEIDPTTITAIFYYVLFGMMLSDAAYGILTTLVCGFVMLKFKKIEGGIGKMIKMFFWCGLSTTFWGFMFGSFFGDAIDIVGKTFFNAEWHTPCLWFAPLEKPMTLLMFSFLLGIIHLFAGLGVQAYQYARRKMYVDIIYDVVAWYMLVGGLVAFALSSPMFCSMTSLTFVLPAIIGKVGIVLAVIGLVIIIFTSGRESKNWGKRILKGLYGAYGVSSYLSDILSYSRLLALGLATGVIASVFNQIGSMFGGGIVGAIIFIIVFIIGHTLNILINLLGAYVHCNRLQFVEFFGKFYEGGGEKFAPFSAKTKYFKLK